MGKKWVIGLIFCLLITGFFSTYKLSESPRTWFDEGIFLQIARNVPLSHGYTLRVSPTELVPAGVLSTSGFPLVGPLSASFALFGIGLLQARIVMVAYILLMVAMAFFFTQRAWDTRHAWWATLLIATHPPVYGNGKNVLGEVPGLFYFFLFLFLLTKLERETKPKTALWIATGLAAGLFIATKSSFILLVPVLGLTFLLLRKRLAFRWYDLALALGALVLPIAVNLVIQFGFSSEIFTSFARYGSLPGLQKITGLTLPGLVLKNLLSFFQQATPAYLLVTLTVWVSSACVRWKRRSQLPLHEYLSLGFVLLSVAYFLKMPGVFRYLFVAQVITFPYFVNACFILIPSQLGPWLAKRRMEAALTVGLVLLILFQGYQVLFRSWVAKAYNETRTSELAAYFAALEPNQHVFFYHATEAVTFFKGENYSQYFQLLYYDDAVGKSELLQLQKSVPDVVIVAEALEAEARPWLGNYQKRASLDQGSYLIFERQ